MNFSFSGIISILIGFLGIGIMILVHEAGHAFAARRCGINVEVLSFGFGPAIKRWRYRNTDYVIRAIPFGGSCKMSGGDDIQAAISQHRNRIENAEEGSIWAVGPLKRVIAYAAGPVANMLFAFLCYAILMSMPTLVETYSPKVVLASDYPTLFADASYAAAAGGLKTGDTVLAIDGVEMTNYTEIQRYLASVKTEQSVVFETDRGTFVVHPENGLFGLLPFQEAVVGHVNAGTPEKQAGLRNGDRIIEINGKSVTNMMDLLEASHSSEEIRMVIQNGDDSHAISFVSQKGVLNFTLIQETVNIPGVSFPKAIIGSARECFSNFNESVRSLFSVILGKSKAGEALGGTFSASQSIGMLTTRGFSHGFNSGMRIVLYLLASVSISLAVANLLPIPALDGGLILISIAELVTRRIFHPRVYVIMQVVGTIMIFLAIGLMQLSKFI